MAISYQMPIWPLWLWNTGLRCAPQTVILRGFAACVGLTRSHPETAMRPRFAWHDRHRSLTAGGRRRLQYSVLTINGCSRQNEAKKSNYFKDWRAIERALTRRWRTWWMRTGSPYGTRGNAVNATAEDRRLLHANSDDWYWLRRARVGRLFFGFWARRNLYRQGCSEDRGAPKRKDPDLRAWFGRARCEQRRSRPAFICDRIRRCHSRGGCGISRRRDAVPARRRFCRPLLRP